LRKTVTQDSVSSQSILAAPNRSEYSEASVKFKQRTQFINYCCTFEDSRLERRLAGCKDFLTEERRAFDFDSVNKYQSIISLQSFNRLKDQTHFIITLTQPGNFLQDRGIALEVFGKNFQPAILLIILY
jgi:hypothetical protein